MIALQERFDSKWIPEPFSGCRLWTAALKHDFGYGAFKFKGRTERAHRVAWMLRHGEIPAGLNVLHRCDTPLCVNPDHLFLGTDVDNSADCSAKGRQPIGARNFNTKLTAEQVFEIRASSDSYSKLAARFGVHKGTIQGIKQGRHWSHLETMKLRLDRLEKQVNDGRPRE